MRYIVFMKNKPITVHPTEPWRLYTLTIPAGMIPLGVVRRDYIDVGALCRVDATGLYVQINAGAVRSLPQRAVREALAGK